MKTTMQMERSSGVGYGWAIVFACLFGTALTSPGQSFAMALYFDAFVGDLETTRLRVSTLYGIATLSAACLLPFMGRLADAWPSRRYFGLVLGCMGMALLLLSSIRSVVGLAIAIFAMRLFFQGAIGLGTLTSVVRWFKQGRARALAIVTLGYSVGELVMPSIIVWLQEQQGWRGSLSTMGTVYLLVLVPLFYLVMRDPPRRRTCEDTFGRNTSSDIPLGQENAKTSFLAKGESEGDSGGDSLREALRRPRFWVLLSVMTISPMVVTGVLIHHVAMFIDVGWEADGVPAALRMYAIGAIVAIYSTGMLLERLPPKFGVVLSMSILASAVSVPLLIPPSEFSMLLYGAMLGASSGMAGTTNEIIWPDYHGVRAIGSIKGFVSMARNGATAVGAPLFAILSGEAAVYRWALVPAVALCLIGALVGALLPRSKENSAAESASAPLPVIEEKMARSEADGASRV